MYQARKRREAEEDAQRLHEKYENYLRNVQKELQEQIEIEWANVTAANAKNLQKAVVQERTKVVHEMMKKMRIEISHVVQTLYKDFEDSFRAQRENIIADFNQIMREKHVQLNKNMHEFEKRLNKELYIQRHQLEMQNAVEIIYLLCLERFRSDRDKHAIHKYFEMNNPEESTDCCDLRKCKFWMLIETGWLILSFTLCKAFMVTHSLDELLISASAKFEIIAKRIFTPQGGEIDDIKLIRDDDVLYVSRGEDFIAKDKICTQGQLNIHPEWITLNVGGKYFTTTRDTLTKKEPMSMLARMFIDTACNEQRMVPSRQDQNGAFLIDRSPTYFEPLLNYLRYGEIILDANVNVKGVLAEARFYEIESAIKKLHVILHNDDFEKSDSERLTRRDVLKAIMSTPTTSELRFQGAVFYGADLSKLDLRNINFKYANLRGCNIEGANLSGCCFERADLSDANLQGAQLVCVKMQCANLAAANLQSCNFEDPGGLPANMESVNLKGANLEGSNMAAVNLRVATLKNAILRNCNLRSAVLAGADLECCDLSGSDLEDANLRGANLKDAVFELMLTPLHMSQTIR
ncbi:uncharacterized protein LOC117607925 isoform X2 [Osmia lignaria lignaria]|nr:BTB/POZ domain-containing protein KCTD9 isoform X3 [Osmia lignaria]